MNSRNLRQISSQEQKLYDYLLYWVELESPAQLLDRFHDLFIIGKCPDSEITAALDQVIFSKASQDEFRFVLNRCCHILINRWQARSQFQRNIPELIHLFDSAPSSTSSSLYRSRSLRRLRELIHQFGETEQYLTLKRLAQVMNEQVDSNQNRVLGSLIRRYPYLYEYCLLSQDSAQEQQFTVRQIQSDMQRQFEINLSQYVTYQVRRGQAARQPNIHQPNIHQSPLIHPVANPTLLSDRELGLALKHYVGKGQGGKTPQDQAHAFRIHSAQPISYHEFKSDLYHYITSSIDPKYGSRQFNSQLNAHLKNTFAESDGQRLNDFLLVRTCDRLFSFLVIDSHQRPNHFVFIDLLTNLGPIPTTGLLLKILLLCRRVKPSLERRFSVLFNHYEGHNRDIVQWLVHALENLHIALSSNFGQIDLSLIR